MDAGRYSDYAGNDPPPPYSPQVGTKSEVVETPVPFLDAPKISPSHALPEGRLSKPIAVPATSKKLGSAFLRAYPPVLESYQISQTTFLDFLDKLNRLATPNPAMQLTGAAAGIVGLVPLPITQIVGLGVQAGATLGTVATSKVSIAAFLKHANAELFGPRKLTVQITRLEALARMTRMPILDATGNLDKNSQLLAPLEEIEDGGLAMTPAQERRLSALEPYIEHLEVTPLPEIKKPENLMMRVNQAASERNRTKAEKKTLKERNETHKDFVKDTTKAKEELHKELAKVDKETEKVLRKEHDPHKIEKEMRKIEKDRQKAYEDYEKETREANKDHVKDDKEEEAMRKINWLVIWNRDEQIP